ncbi:MAG: class I SAM-dependent methyltransferase [Actinomycetia bacterium]|nr:class I SAM-dependent methyltransferase [Actinomycetes bacterium]
MARRAMQALLNRMTTGRITIVDQGGAIEYGPDLGRPWATVRVLDDRAWVAVATEGSIGFGRGYLERWWETNDLVGLLRLTALNLEPLGRWQRRKATATRLAPGGLLRALAPTRAARDREDIAAHYDIGTDFFSLFLDETLTYSSAVFASDDTPLAEASIHKYDRLLDKLEVDTGDRVLEIGTGWGGFAIHAASTRGARVTTTTISADQHREATRRVAEAGLGPLVEVLDIDWRELPRHVAAGVGPGQGDGRFDKVVSVEMIEAVSWRDYKQFLATIEGCMAPDGMAALQAICVPGRRFEAAKRTEDFIKRFVFPGGGLPSLDVLAASVSGATSMQLLDVEDLSAHYGETLRRWHQQFDASQGEVAALLFDERFCRLWRFYLAYCEAAFDERLCTLNQIVLVGPAWRPSGMTLRPR